MYVFHRGFGEERDFQGLHVSSIAAIPVGYRAPLSPSRVPTSGPEGQRSCTTASLSTSESDIQSRCRKVVKLAISLPSRSMLEKFNGDLPTTRTLISQTRLSETPRHHAARVHQCPLWRTVLGLLVDCVVHFVVPSCIGGESTYYYSW